MQGADANQSQVPAHVEKLAERVIDALPDLPQEKRAEVARVIRQISRYHSGPLPDAETLDYYNRIIPNGADRIMALLEREAAHRHEQEKTIINTQRAITLRSRWVGAGLTAILTSAGTYLGATGHNTLAGVIFATTIVAVITVLVLGRRNESDHPAKSESDPEPLPEKAEVAAHDG